MLNFDGSHKANKLIKLINSNRLLMSLDISTLADYATVASLVISIIALLISLLIRDKVQKNSIKIDTLNSQMQKINVSSTINGNQIINAQNITYGNQNNEIQEKKER